MLLLVLFFFLPNLWVPKGEGWDLKEVHFCKSRNIWIKIPCGAQHTFCQNNDVHVLKISFSDDSIKLAILSLRTSWYHFTMWTSNGRKWRHQLLLKILENCGLCLLNMMSSKPGFSFRLVASSDSIVSAIYVYIPNPIKQ